MNFFDRLKYSLARMMQGRYGADQLSRALTFTALALAILNIFLHTLLLSLIVYALLIWSIVRMFSRNSTARYAENQKYLELKNRFVPAIKQAWIRLKNSKEYKYFRCPKCKSWIKLKRGAGEGTVTCGKCGERFKMKA